MINESGLEPLGVAVLIKQYEPERKGGLIEIPDVVKGRMSMVEDRAVVIAVGPAAWHDEPVPRAKVGDKVLVSKFSGYLAKGPADEQTYRIVNDRDIFCAIVGGE
jgi:co-chaperonin GroES (HSP10)